MFNAEEAQKLTAWASLNPQSLVLDVTLNRVLAKIKMAASLGEYHTMYYRFGGPIDWREDSYFDIGETIPGIVYSKTKAALRELGFAVCESNQDSKIIIGWNGETEEWLYKQYGNQ